MQVVLCKHGESVGAVRKDPPKGPMGRRRSGWAERPPELTVDYDLLVGGTQNLSLDDDCTGSELAFSLNVSVSAVDLGAKVPTYLLVPPGGGTLRTLPDGQSEYVGEDAFDVVVVNVNSTTPVTSDPIPEPDSASTCQLTLQPGPNAFLVPRTQFLNTTLGYALLRNEPMPEPSPFWSDTAPLIGSAEAEAMQNLTGDNWEGPLGSLSCYWQQRSLPETAGDSDSSGVCDFPEYGVLDTGPEFVNVNLDGANATSTNAGGLPSDPTLEDATDAGGSLQGLFLVNVNNTTYDNLTTGQEVNLGPVPSLDLLLAALLDNTTEGVNGTVEEVTPQLYGLGLSWAVLTAIPNATLVYSAVYGPPTEVQTSQTGGCSWLGCVWEALTSIPEWFVEGVGYFFSGDWIVAFEGWAASVSTELNNTLNGFFEGVWQVVFDFGAVVEGLVFFGAALDAALLTLIGTALKTLATDVLDPLFGPLIALFIAYAATETVNTAALIADPSPATIAQWWDGLGGSVFLLGLLVATILLTVLTIVEGVVPGAGFILGLLVSALVSVGVQDAISHSPLDAASLGESRDVGEAATVIRDAICSVDQASYQAACGNSTLLGGFSAVGSAVSDVGAYASSGLAGELIAQGTANDPLFNVEVGFALGICGIAFAGYAYSNKDWQTALAGAVVSWTGFFIDEITPFFTEPSLRTLDTLSTYLDAATAIGATAELAGFF